MNVENKLREMKGKSFLVNGMEQTIANYQVDTEGDKVTIVTDKKFFSSTINESKDMLAGFLEISNDRYMVPSRSEIFYKDAPPLLQILKDNIKRVQDDVEYIEQAKTINEMVKSAIMLSKTMIEAERLKRMV